MAIYWKYDELLEAVRKTGRPSRALGHTVDGSPLVCVRSGGEREPAILITAGSHSTEHAGVAAANPSPRCPSMLNGVRAAVQIDSDRYRCFGRRVAARPSDRVADPERALSGLTAR